MIHYVYYYSPSGQLAWYGSATDDVEMPAQVGDAYLLIVDDPLDSDDYRVTFYGSTPTLTPGRLEDDDALARAKEEKLLEMRTARDNYIISVPLDPTWAPSYYFQNTPAHLTGLNSAITAHTYDVANGADDEYDWSGIRIDNGREEAVTLTLQQMKDLLSAMNAVVKVAMGVYRTRKASIEACTTIEQVEEIGWDFPV